jgi:hypothetical protein
VSSTKDSPGLDRFQKYILDQIRLRELRPGSEIRLYLDVWHVANAIQGVYRFLGESGRAPFTHDSTLVSAILLTGAIPNVYLLPPHQIELANLIRKDFNLGSLANLTHKQAAIRFFDLYPEFGVARDDGASVQISIASNSDHSEWKKHLKLYTFLSRPWWDRMGELETERWIHLESGTGFDYVSLMHNDLFRAVEDFLRTSRGNHLEKNNRRDALAMAIIAESVERYNERKSDVAPIFVLERASELRHAVQGCGLEGRFDLMIAPYAQVSALQDEQFFKLYYAIGADNELADEESEAARWQIELKKLGGPHLEASWLADVFGQVRAEEIAQGVLEYGEVTLIDVFVGDVVGENNRVHSQKAEAEIQLNLAVLQKAEQNVRKRREKLRQAILKGTEGIDEITELLDIVRRASAFLKERFFNWSVYRDKLKFVLRLAPFGLPDSVVDRVVNISMSMVTGSRDARDRERELTRIYSIAMGVRNGEGLDGIESVSRSDALGVALAIMWLSRSEETLSEGHDVADYMLQLLDENRDLEKQHSWLTVIRYVVYHRKGMRKEADVALRRLERWRSTDALHRPEIGMGLALCYFRHANWAWKANQSADGLGAALESSATEDAIEDFYDGAHLRKAVGYALEAYTAVPNEEKRLFALNQLVYYLAKDTNCDMNKLRQYGTRLIAAQKSFARYWTYQYDDTLSWFFWRLYRGTDDSNARDRFLEAALEKKARVLQCGPKRPLVQSEYEFMAASSSGALGRVGVKPDI